MEETSSTLRGGVEGAVEDEASDLSRVEAGVGGAEEGAVGVAQEVELVLAEDGAHHVEVAGGADRVDVLEDGAGVVAASLREFARVFLHFGDRGLRAVGVRAFGFGARVVFVLLLVGLQKTGGGVADARGSRATMS